MTIRDLNNLWANKPLFMNMVLSLGKKIDDDINSPIKRLQFNDIDIDILDFDNFAQLILKFNETDDPKQDFDKIQAIFNDYQHFLLKQDNDSYVALTLGVLDIENDNHLEVCFLNPLLWIAEPDTYTIRLIIDKKLILHSDTSEQIQELEN